MLYTESRSWSFFAWGIASVFSSPEFHVRLNTFSSNTGRSQKDMLIASFDQVSTLRTPPSKWHLSISKTEEVKDVHTPIVCKKNTGSIKTDYYNFYQALRQYQMGTMVKPSTYPDTDETCVRVTPVRSTLHNIDVSPKRRSWTKFENIIFRSVNRGSCRMDSNCVQFKEKRVTSHLPWCWWANTVTKR